MRYIVLPMMLLFAGLLHAQSEIPEFVTKGLDAYQQSGGQAAMAVWLKGSAIEGDTTTRMNVAGGLTQIDIAYGKMVGFDPIRVVSIASSMRRVYMLVKFEKGPVFFVFDCYKAPKAWIVATIDFNTKANNILPAEILTGAQ